MTVTDSSIKGWAREFAAYFTGLRHVMTRYRPFISPMARLVELAGGGKTLDIGCGNALFPYLLFRADKSHDITGVELSMPLVDMANQALSKAKLEPYIKIVQAETPQDWPHDTFDMVSMIDVMHHVPPSWQQDFFVAMAQRVKPGGMLLYKDMCRKPMWRALANRLHDLVLARQIIHYAPIADIEKWAKMNGLSLQHTEEINMLWYGHELRVFIKGEVL